MEIRCSDYRFFELLYSSASKWTGWFNCNKQLRQRQSSYRPAI